MTITASSSQTADNYPTRTTDEPALLRRHDPVVYGRPADGPLDDKTLDGFDTNGFLTVEGLITPGDKFRRNG